MSKINAEHEDQRKLDIEMLEFQFNEKVLQMRYKLEKEIFNDYCQKVTKSLIDLGILT